jgi:RNA polymerase sigma-70 factor (ECF subfamily)
MNRIDDRIVTRRSLLSRIKNLDDNESWETFCDLYRGLIHGTAVKSGLTREEAQDVVQEVFASIVKSMPTFQYDPQKGSFKTRLLNLTRWRILDQFEKRDKRLAGRTGPPETSTRTPTVERQPDPAGPELDAIWAREWEGNLLKVAANKIRANADPKQYQIFDLLVFKEWPVARVAQFLGISAPRVYLAKHRIYKLVKAQIAQILKNPT